MKVKITKYYINSRNWFKFVPLIFNNVIYKEIDKKNFISCYIHINFRRLYDVYRIYNYIYINI